MAHGTCIYSEDALYKIVDSWEIPRAACAYQLWVNKVGMAYNFTWATRVASISPRGGRVVDRHRFPLLNWLKITRRVTHTFLVVD